MPDKENPDKCLTPARGPGSIEAMEEALLRTVGQAVTTHYLRLEEIMDALLPAGSKAPTNDQIHEYTRKVVRGHAPLPTSKAVHDMALLISSTGSYVPVDGMSTIGRFGDLGKHTMGLAIRYLGFEKEAYLGETHFVPEEILDLLDGAAAGLEPECLRETDLIAPSGVMLFEKPKMMGDYHPVTGEWTDDLALPWRGIAWVAASVVKGGGDYTDKSAWDNGVLLFPLVDYQSLTEYYYPNWLKIDGAVEPGSDIEGAMKLLNEQNPIAVRPIEIHAWACDSPWDAGTYDSYNAREAETTNPNTLNLPPHIAELRKVFLSFMRLCWQELLTRDSCEDVPRGVRKSADRTREKSKLAGKSIVNIVRLRRRASSGAGDGTSGRKLEHRMVVKGHWRNQYYSSLGPVDSPASHRLIYINPHIRGPEEAPLRVGHKVTIL